MLYDRSLAQIMAEEALPELPPTFSTSDMLNWVHSRYPRFKENTVRAHLIAMAANDPNKKHYGTSRTVWRDRLFKLGPNSFRRYDPEADPAPLAVDTDSAAEGDDAEDTDLPESQMNFVLEAHLEEFMESNWARINFGSALEMYADDAGRPARQFPTSVGVIDFLCEDTTTGDLIVVELKKGRPGDAVLGQCQRYMGWVQQNLAGQGQKVRGLIVAPEPDERLRYALLVARDIDLRCYKVDFQLVDPALVDSHD